MHRYRPLTHLWYGTQPHVWDIYSDKQHAQVSCSQHVPSWISFYISAPHHFCDDYQVRPTTKLATPIDANCMNMRLKVASSPFCWQVGILTCDMSLCQDHANDLCLLKVNSQFISWSKCPRPNSKAPKRAYMPTMLVHTVRETLQVPSIRKFPHDRQAAHEALHVFSQKRMEQPCNYQ